MVIKNGVKISFVLKETMKPLVYLISISLFAWIVYTTTEFKHDLFSFAILGVLGTALSIFLGFRINEAYERWWEARKLWGALVNYSRSFARQINTLVTRENLNASEDLKSFREEMILRHVAYINALRLHLRNQEDFDLLGKYVDEEEIEYLKEKKNVPAFIAHIQSERLRSSFKSSLSDNILLYEVDKNLIELYNIQGGCERIKNTVFPEHISHFATTMAWIFSSLVPFAIIEVERFDWFEIMTGTFIGLTLIITDRLGMELKNPFENAANDIPMTALCRTIEIDLLQMLGETDLPEKVKSNEGVLL
ncbi:bestrophin family protein [Aureibacter tunicatorum]|uniref:Membrane protein n=1 Tax=Aureibacter tunicatorum TaxID=866807 RepID=A0AAE3XHE1_9BACT|nr:bestrophin family ion channel [Aureibacter tunicatorum]MDR6237711.1 putative membrane protein [Aureibacter tunicatorum]BDD02746.1 hypothetical protein AUTU_02290 [Aureibacter tunicatorum]